MTNFFRKIALFGLFLSAAPTHPLFMNELTPDQRNLALWMNAIGMNDIQETAEQKISFATARKLDLIGSSKVALRNLFPTVTAMGEAQVTKELLNCDNGEFNQKIVAGFSLIHPDVLAQVTSALEKIKAGTTAYFSFLNASNNAHAEQLNQYYFSGDLLKRFNKNIYALAALHTARNSMQVLSCLPQELASVAIFDYIDAYFASGDLSLAGKAKLFALDTPAAIARDLLEVQRAKHSFQRSDKDLAGDIGRAMQSITSPSEFIKKMFQFNKNALFATLGDNIQLYNTVLPYPVAFAISTLGQATVDAQNIHRVYSTLQTLKQDGKTFRQLQKRLVAVALLVQGLSELEELMSNPQRLEIPELHALALDLRTLLYQENSGSEIGDLLSMLKTGTFDDVAYWSNRPRILTANSLMLEHAHAFVPALLVAGKIDSLQAAAQLYRDHQKSATSYCFVDFIDHSLPVIDLVNFWHPLMSAEQAVVNSLNLGVQGSPNALILGPNGTGKSVTMGAIMINVILAQAFGIAAAEAMTLTPFTHLNVYRNEQEDLQENLSTFMAEAKKLDEICAQIAALKADEKSFAIMDEMLKGTVDPSGLIDRMGSELAQQPQSIVMMATHCDVTQLEAKTGSRFVNYHLEVQEPTPHNFVRTYKLIKGAPTWWFNDVAKRDAFINQLTRRVVAV